MMDKTTLRQALIARRKNLKGKEKNLKNQLINKYLLSYLEPYSQCTIGAYLAFGGEPNLAPAIQCLYHNGHSLAVPRISQNQPGLMEFHHWSPQTVLELNRYGIAEPLTDSQIFTAEQFDILLIPLVGFDDHGHRLGMGAGFYDRWLADTCDNKPERIGIAYHWQQQASIPFDTMDQPLHRVITDQGCIHCSPLDSNKT